MDRVFRRRPSEADPSGGGASVDITAAPGFSAGASWEAKTVRLMFVWQGGRVALVGIVVGTLAAVGLTTYIQTLLFNVGRLDVLAFAAMSAVMLAVALPASYVPALRVSRVELALRAE
jgi:macrolide transport system ATP-binding/permease protein